MHPTRRVILCLLGLGLVVGLCGCGGSPAAFAQLATQPARHSAEDAPPALSPEEERSVYWGDWRHITYLPGGYPNDRVDVNLSLEEEGFCSYYVYNMEAGWDVFYHGDLTVVENEGLQLELEKYSGSGPGEEAPDQLSCLVTLSLDADMPWYAAVTVEEGDALPFGMEEGDTLAMTRMVWPDRAASAAEPGP